METGRCCHRNRAFSGPVEVITHSSAANHGNKCGLLPWRTCGCSAIRSSWQVSLRFCEHQGQYFHGNFSSVAILIYAARSSRRRADTGAVREVSVSTDCFDMPATNNVTLAEMAGNLMHFRLPDRLMTGCDSPDTQATTRAWWKHWPPRATACDERRPCRSCVALRPHQGCRISFCERMPRFRRHAEGDQRFRGSARVLRVRTAVWQ